MSGGEITCGSCGTKNRGDARFCKECGRPMDTAAAPEIRGNHWARRTEDFAVRVDASDLQGIFKRGIIVEPGTNAMLIDGGANRGMLGPGTYNMDSLDKRLSDWIATGIGSQVTALLVDVTPTDMNFAAGGIFTKDSIRIGVRVRLQAQVEEPGKFLVNMLGGRERLTCTELEGYLYPEINQVLEAWVAGHTVQELAEDLSLRPQLELALDEALKISFRQMGLKLINVRATELNLEHLDHIKGIRSKYTLQISEIEAETQGKAGLFAAIRSGQLQQWVEDAAKVEDEEHRAEIYQRMRQVVMNGKMDEIRTEAEFDVFLDGIDRQKLLREKERAELLKTWREDTEDKDRTRAHMLAKLDMERNYELRSAELRLRTDLSQKEQEAEIQFERVRSERQYEIETQKLDFALKQARQKAEYEAEMLKKRQLAEIEQAEREMKLRGSLHSQDMQEMLDQLKVAQAGFEVINNNQRQKKEIEWEDERRRMDAKWAQQLKQIEVDLEREHMRNQYELDRLDKLGKLGTEALIAASPAEQGRILADLKRNEAFKDMNEDQILALAARDSPDVARALQEKFKAMAEGRSSEREREMYEKLLAEKDSRERATIEAWDKSSARAKETTERALDKMAEVAQAFARGSGGTPVIITGTGGGQVLNPSGAGYTPTSASGQAKTCPKCGRFVAAESRHCEFCGHKFEGVS